MFQLKYLFKYNPRNHCWQAIRKSIKAIILYTLLLTAIETFIVYEINKLFEVSEGVDIIAPAVFGLFNSVILRRYICIISTNNYGDPRFGCHGFIFLFSWIFITIGVSMEHNVRAEMYVSNTFDEIVFKEDDYYYIDHVGTLDTINSERYILYEEIHPSRSLPKHYIKGYYIAPFCNRKSVFYAIKLERKYSTRKYTESESREMFTHEFLDTINRIRPVVSNHLFQRISPQARDYNAYCTSIAFSSFSQKPEYEGIEALFTPVENDRMPRWYDELLKYAMIIVIYFLLLIFGFGACKTEKSTKMNTCIAKTA